MWTEFSARICCHFEAREPYRLDKSKLFFLYHSLKWTTGSECYWKCGNWSSEEKLFCYPTRCVCILQAAPFTLSLSVFWAVPFAGCFERSRIHIGHDGSSVSFILTYISWISMVIRKMGSWKTRRLQSLQPSHPNLCFWQGCESRVRYIFRFAAISYRMRHQLSEKCTFKTF